MKIYLASGSPRRKKLLGWLGLDYEVVDHGVDEEEYRNSDGEAMAAELALAKAYGGAEKSKSGLVIGSDLTVVLGEKQYGKPKDLRQAKQFLRDLSGKRHSIFCGVAVVEVKSGQAVMSVDETKVTMKLYDDKIINRYAKKFKLLDKGGGYAIQFLLPDYGSLVEKIEGSITTVIGLPLHYLENLLKEFGVKVDKGWREKCKKETGYEY